MSREAENLCRGYSHLLLVENGFIVRRIHFRVKVAIAYVRPVSLRIEVDALAHIERIGKHQRCKLIAIRQHPFGLMETRCKGTLI